MSPQPQNQKGKEKKKEKKAHPLQCVAQQQNLRGKQSRNEGMSISKRTGYFRRDIRDKKMSQKRKNSNFFPSLINNSNETFWIKQAFKLAD